MTTKETEPASTQVFRLPELLQPILEQIPPTKHADHIKRPTFQFFVLKSVNSTFKSIIEDSKICRQQMHLEHPVQDPSPKDQLHLVQWLCHELNWHVQLSADMAPVSPKADLEPVRPKHPICIDTIGPCEGSEKVRKTVARFSRVSAWREVKWSMSVVAEFWQQDLKVADYERGFLRFVHPENLGILLECTGGLVWWHLKQYKKWEEERPEREEQQREWREWKMKEDEAKEDERREAEKKEEEEEEEERKRHEKEEHEKMIKIVVWTVAIAVASVLMEIFWRALGESG
ncbi:hypothetical protein CLAFUW4_06635 [Fulvia fulva]|uniref:Uncharacterized protein n=1 Tax=Passalora fulva TaxID=5499 RepID=A0A9Q8P9Y5_PASFU|nr:uncharacterized protein CLAFUR5_06780 [Fulvia fulva]KAK4621392.1 hypothetical protein CLAFUR4_06643 [Fulvia fulva]KAK4622557.1 hypothetical protein CLAFUR0_06637 [Fulvia fulva]UJO18607.1 hypothetical protein CLAFUR5_06780 [Fulvia fulva]WPV16086.1 hypothetical protein CLAFUW4_06635 [Fulvia fulva]WPV30962.1 hypothetical protein CLAFUW7_06634 [Fulvia fulva]